MVDIYKYIQAMRRAEKPRLRLPYWQLLLLPSLAIVLGFTMNALVMAANHASMPVLTPVGISWSPEDWLHHNMTPATHLKLLADWIVIRGEGIASLGDFLLWGGDKTREICWIVWAALVIRDANGI